MKYQKTWAQMQAEEVQKQNDRANMACNLTAIALFILLIILAIYAY